MNQIVIHETREEREKREEHALIDSMYTIYYFYGPHRPRFELTP